MWNGKAGFDGFVDWCRVMFDYYFAFGKPLVNGEREIPYQYSCVAGSSVFAEELAARQVFAVRKGLNLAQVEAVKDNVGRLFLHSEADKFLWRLDASIDAGLRNALDDPFVRVIDGKSVARDLK